MSKVVNCKHSNFDVYCGRPSKWGNPFEIGKDGSRSEVIAKHMTYLRNNPALLRDLHELDGKTLGCFCKPRACHCDNYVEILQERKLFDF